MSHFPVSFCIPSFVFMLVVNYFPTALCGVVGTPGLLREFPPGVPWLLSFSFLRAVLESESDHQLLPFSSMPSSLAIETQTEEAQSWRPDCPPYCWLSLSSLEAQLGGPTGLLRFLQPPCLTFPTQNCRLTSAKQRPAPGSFWSIEKTRVLKRLLRR